MTPERVEGEAGLHDSTHDTTRTISDSSFFREHRASTLPSPADVRAIKEESGNIRGTKFNRSPPVKFPSLGLIVKYGADTTVTEAETENMIYKQLKGKGPDYYTQPRKINIFLSLYLRRLVEEKEMAL